MKRGPVLALAVLALLCGCLPKKEDASVPKVEFSVKPDPHEVARAAADAKAALSVKVDPNRAFDMPPPIEEDQNVELKLDQKTIDRYAQRGVISAYADWCGLDYKNQSFGPFMIEERGRNYMEDPNYTYAALIHTLMMERTRRKLAGPCPDEMKAELAKVTTKTLTEKIPEDITDPGKL
jgi:hypothetical protein